ncbi:MAG: lipid-A-disaccharide synthase [Rhizobacter sp.]|nr:lipid-A-disaccharide synthase [Chlorobiales bacterium]
MFAEVNHASKKLFVLAGEASGDLHAAEVITALRQQRPHLDVFGIGGVHLKAAGVRLLYETSQINFMGFVEVAKHYFFLRRVIEDVKRSVLKEKPMAALLVDYPGMNLLLAEFFHQQHIPVIYYIAPQAWAWKEGRIEKMKRFITRLCVVFDFEVDFFQSRGMNATFVGHPIIEEIERFSPETREAFGTKHSLSLSQPRVGLLPGSRPQELERIFPAMLGAARLLKEKFNAAFLLGTAPTIAPEVYDKFLEGSDLNIVRTSAYGVMSQSDLVLVTSGTATLETLCFGTPMVVLYKAARLNYEIGRRLVKIQNIALANIVSQGLYATVKTVPELLQDEMTPERIAREAVRFLQSPELAATTRQALLNAKSKLGSLRPSAEVSKIILETLGETD